MPFVANRDRDAWATIRGFVYQVDLTIVRWLELEAGQLLELERGEDIDLVSRALGSSDQAEESRLLEQAKHRVAGLTLKSPEVVEFLSNVHGHILANPTIGLRFRFLTNARPAQERPSPFQPARSGIEVWEALRFASSESPESIADMSGLRVLISQAAPPQGSLLPAWKGFVDSFVRGPAENAFELVQRIEWATSTTDHNQLPTRVADTLLRDSRARDRPEAEAIHARLFLHVFRLLSQEGLKRLTTQDLEAQLMPRPLQSSELLAVQTLLSDAAGRISDAEARITRVEGTLDVMGSRISEVADAPDRIAILERELAEIREAEREEEEFHERVFELVSLHTKAWNLSQPLDRYVLDVGRSDYPRKKLEGERLAAFAELKAGAKSIRGVMIQLNGWKSQLEREGVFDAERVAKAKAEIDRVQALFDAFTGRGRR